MKSQKDMPKKKHVHKWDKDTGVKQRGIPHVGIKPCYIRTCECGVKQKHVSINTPGFSTNGWWTWNPETKLWDW